MLKMKDDHKGQFGHKWLNGLNQMFRHVYMLPEYAYDPSKVLLKVSLKD